MLYANRDGEKVQAEPRTEGTCPACDQPLRPKCGEIKVWHWAHISDLGCSAEHEPETDWHREWKLKFPKESVEVPIGDHRADVLTPRGIVVELQHSPISTEQIRAREKEYDRMVWVIDAREAYENDHIVVGEAVDATYLRIYFQRRWRPSLKFCTRPVFLDLGGRFDMVQLVIIHQRKATRWEKRNDEMPVSSGYDGTYQEFVDALMGKRIGPYNGMPIWMNSSLMWRWTTNSK